MAGKHQSDKTPLNHLLAKKYPDTDTQKLYSAILCGEIIVNGEKLRDSKAPVPKSADVEWKAEKYVGRGGLKLEGALDELALNPKGMVCLDAGSSTGGFTDCLLSRGALCVHAVDVGYNQLAWRIRSDDRVEVHEQTNLMHLSWADLNPHPEFAVADLSFRSLRGAASKLLALTDGGIVLALVKPQFEQPVEEGFAGIVRTREARAAVLKSLIAALLIEGVHVHDAVASGVTGRKGNVEIFLLLSGEAADDQLYVDRRIDTALASCRT